MALVPSCFRTSQTATRRANIANICLRRERTPGVRFQDHPSTCSAADGFLLINSDGFQEHAQESRAQDPASALSLSRVRRGTIGSCGGIDTQSHGHQAIIISSVLELFKRTVLDTVRYTEIHTSVDVIISEQIYFMTDSMHRTVLCHPECNDDSNTNRPQQ